MSILARTRTVCPLRGMYGYPYLGTVPTALGVPYDYNKAVRELWGLYYSCLLYLSHRLSQPLAPRIVEGAQVRPSTTQRLHIWTLPPGRGGRPHACARGYT